MKKISLIFVSVALFLSCSSKTNQYVLTGKFDNCKSDSIWILDDKLQVLASVPTTDGSFSFSGSFDVTGVGYVSAAKDPEQTNCRCSFILEPGTLQMTFPVDSLAVITGSKGNDALSELQITTYNISKRLRENGGRATDDLIALLDQRTEKMKKDLLNNLDNMYGLILVESLESPDDPESTRKILDRFSDEVKKSDAWKEISGRVDKMLSFGVGKPYLDFTQNDPDGKPVTASAVMATPGNRYVLIDFWASWCGPCMNEIPYLKQAYDKYSGKGFEIIGVSLDMEREQWLAAIKERELNWIHVSDLKYWSNEVSRQYNINSIPANFLVDCETGLIVEKGLRGQALINKLADLLK